MTESSADPAGASSVPFRIAFVPGVTPGKWSRIWERRVLDIPLEVTPIDESDQIAVLREGRADMSFVRLPVDPEGLSVIPLYREIPVVVVPKDHPVTAYDEVTVLDLADEHLLQDPDTIPAWRDVACEVRDGTGLEVPPMTTEEAIDVVASGSGIVILPMSVARLHHRKDVTQRPVTDVPDSQIGLAWLAGALDTRMEKFIGIVRGRTERSSRENEADVPEKEAASTKRSATSKPGQKKDARRPPGKLATRRAGRRGRRSPG